MKTTFATRLRKIIDQCHNGSQAVAASKWGSTTATISRVYNGLNIPSTELVQQICRTPGLNISWFVTGVGNPFDNINEIKLPVFNTLLPQRLTKEHSAALGYRKTVRYREADTRYWYHATKQSCMYDGRKERLPAQYLMIETCPAFIDSYLGAFRIGCILLPSGKPVFATIQSSTDGGITLEMKKSTPRSGAGGCDAFDLLEMDPSWDGWDEETKRQMKNKLPHAALSDSENTQPNLPPEAWTIHLNNTKDILGLVIAREEDNG